MNESNESPALELLLLDRDDVRDEVFSRLLVYTSLRVVAVVSTRLRRCVAAFFAAPHQWRARTLAEYPFEHNFAYLLRSAEETEDDWEQVFRRAVLRHRAADLTEAPRALRAAF